MDNNFKEKNKPEGRIFAGLILVAVGAVLLLRNSGFPLPRWLFTWPMILILVGIYSGIKHNFKNNGWLIMIGVGGFFLADKLIPGLSMEPYFWPILIIAVGILFILRPKRNKQWGCNNSQPTQAGNITAGAWQKNEETRYEPDDNDFLKMSSVFSGVQKSIVSKNFQGGKLSCVFGGADIDLAQADIHGRIEIKFEVVFGGVKLIIPPHWTVINEIDGVFHGIEDKRRYKTESGTNPEKVVVLRGSVVFGGVEIKSPK
jgi:hypothetical protein